MDSVQRVMAAIDHRIPDRVPLDYWAVPEMDEQLMARFNVPDLPALRRHMKVDLAAISLLTKNSPMAQLGGEDWYDEWGCRVHWIDHGRGGGYWERVTNSLAWAQTVEDLRSFAWPDLEVFDWDLFSRDLDANEGLALGIDHCGLFENHWYLRGFEQSLTDLALNPELAHHLIGAITDFACAMVDKLAEVADGRGHMVRARDDWGMQTSLLMSQPMFRTFYKEPLRRWMDTARAHGLRIFFHTDGTVVDLLDDFVDLGIDILNPIQTTCPGMDPVFLKREYGDKLCFHGAIDTQGVLPHGSAEDTKRHVLLRMAQLGEGGGYIVAPCHNLQANVPIENVIAMYETVWEHGRYPLDAVAELERIGGAG